MEDRPRYESQLRGAVDALTINSKTRFAWFGVSQSVLTSRVAAELTRDDVRRHMREFDRRYALHAVLLPGQRAPANWRPTC